ncbi:MAG: VTT domain-containing protein [Sphingomonas sp.]|uniref:DedA family protein n=1 Tax=Sphingomonas sp. TaxID=28214 RepID=UPI001B0AE545|nr:VTT domain-containing protein [Sphingomonas sp.]MBO9622446.1 VTT domain-containing protein [Sphingomonas sp.]
MDQLLHWMDSAVTTHAGLVALAFVLVALAESTAFVGVVLPATPILLLMGGLLGAGRISPWAIIPGAIAGAIAGYGLSYMAGRRLRGRLGRIVWLRRQRRSMARVRLFLRAYGPHAVILGRYALGPLHSLLPLVAGSIGMDRRRFWSLNTLSGMIWVPVTLAPGYVAARAADAALVPAAWRENAMAILALISIVATTGLLLFVLSQSLVRTLRRRQARTR